jgi:hypothetical protein
MSQMFQQALWVGKKSKDEEQEVGSLKSIAGATLQKKLGPE